MNPDPSWSWRTPLPVRQAAHALIAIGRLSHQCRPRLSVAEWGVKLKPDSNFDPLRAAVEDLPPDAYAQKRDAALTLLRAAFKAGHQREIVRA